MIILASSGLSQEDRDKLDNLNSGYLGFYTDPAALNLAHPSPADGSFATVGTTDTMWAWDSDTLAWIDTLTNAGDMFQSLYDPQGVAGDAFARANMTGTQLAVTISDLQATITANVAVALNTAKVTNVSTDLSVGTVDANNVDVNSSDGNNATLPSATNAAAGVATATQIQAIEANTAKVTNVSTDLSNSVDDTNVTVESSDGNDTIVAPATGVLAGVLSAIAQTIGGLKTFLLAPIFGNLTAGNELLLTDITGQVKESGIKVDDAPVGGSGFTFLPYASAPVGAVAGFVWIEDIDVNTKSLNFFDGVDTYGVHLTK